MTVLDPPEVQIRLDAKVRLSRKTSDLLILSNIVLGDKGQSAYVSKGENLICLAIYRDGSGRCFREFGQVNRSKSKMRVYVQPKIRTRS
jgi:hypothetical protein